MQNNLDINYLKELHFFFFNIWLLYPRVQAEDEVKYLFWNFYSDEKPSPGLPSLFKTISSLAL